jgi:hypothetical protein
MGNRPKVTECPNRSVKGTPGDLKQTANGSSQKPPAALLAKVIERSTLPLAESPFSRMVEYCGA